MKHIALGVLVCLALASVGYAQQDPADAPASRADIERYLEVAHTRELMKNMVDAMKKQMHQMVHQQVEKESNLPPDFEARMDKMADDIFKNFPDEELLQAMIPVYQKHFTKGDVDALVAFYSSPRGQKILKELPAMTAEAMQAASGVIQKTIAKAMQQVEDQIAQAQKEYNKSAAKKPQTN
jgi:uncharacterized protein